MGPLGWRAGVLPLARRRCHAVSGDTHAALARVSILHVLSSSLMLYEVVLPFCRCHTRRLLDGKPCRKISGLETSVERVSTRPTRSALFKSVQCLGGDDPDKGNRRSQVMEWLGDNEVSLLRFGQRHRIRVRALVLAWCGGQGSVKPPANEVSEYADFQGGECFNFAGVFG